MRAIAVLVALNSVACSSEAPSPPTSTRVLEVAVGDAIVFIKPVAADLAETVDVELANVTRTTLTQVARRWPLPKAEIYVDVDASRAIPEVGVGGRTHIRNGGIQISFDPDTASVDSFLTWYPRLLAHELHHSKRIIEGPGYGESLGEQVVTEGLADAFSLEVFPEGPPLPWTDALSSAAYRDSKRAFFGALDIRMTTRKHLVWFFGTGDLPKWAGYTLGEWVVDKYLKSSETTAGDLVTTAASRILRSATRGSVRG